MAKAKNNLKIKFSISSCKKVRDSSSEWVLFYKNQLIDGQLVGIKNKKTPYIFQKNKCKNLRGITKCYTFASL